jgi:hypothetical protein
MKKILLKFKERKFRNEIPKYPLLISLILCVIYIPFKILLPQVAHIIAIIAALGFIPVIIFTMVIIYEALTPVSRK